MKWVVILVALAAGAYWFVRTRPSTGSDKRNSAGRSGPKSKAVEHEFHGISIEFAEDTACEAVKALANKRFLSSDVPPLPVAECDSKNCNCRYIHYDDRRTGGEDRRLAASLHWDLADRPERTERRNEKGRRKTD